MLIDKEKSLLNIYFGNNTVIEIPSECTKIGDSVFLNSKITRVTFESDNLISIGSSSFQGTLITEISLPSTVESIGDSAFKDCKSLTSIDISQTKITKITPNCFSGCVKLGTFTPSSELNLIEEYAFYMCTELSSFDMSETQIETISSYSFYQTKLSSIKFPETLLYLGISSFESCSELESIDLREAKVERIPLFCFAYCEELTELYLTDTINTFEEDCFRDAHKLESFVVPYNIKTFEKRCFYGCHLLHNVTFPLNCHLETVKGQSFGDCSKLKEFYIDEKDENFKFENDVLMNKEGTEVRFLGTEDFCLKN